jgi:hypothetical protein
MLICAFTSFSVSIKQDVEVEQLKNILEHVAAQSCELISTTTTNNSSATLQLSLPSNLGEKSYWIQFRNDSSNAWVEGGLASTPVETSLKIYVPGTVNASGLYKSGYGFAELECQLQEGAVYLNLAEAS